MLNYTYSQGIPNFKALVCIEYKLKAEISQLRIRLIKEEKLLYSTILKLAALEEGIKRFYSTYYLEKLGKYILLLESLKKKFWGFEDKKSEAEDKKKDNNDCDEKKLKELYRQLAKIYHPDRYDFLTDEEKEFFEFRMSEANKYFEKKDIQALEGMLEQAKAELSDDIPSSDRVRLLSIRIEMIEDLRRLYNNKIELLKTDEIYRIMNMPPSERDKEIEKKKEIFMSEIRVYSELIQRSKTSSQKC